MQYTSDWRMADLARQAREFERNRSGDGHNRRSGIVTSHRLGIRRNRREWRRRLDEWARTWVAPRSPRPLPPLAPQPVPAQISPVAVPLAVFWPRTATDPMDLFPAARDRAARRVV